MACFKQAPNAAAPPIRRKTAAAPALIELRGDVGMAQACRFQFDGFEGEKPSVGLWLGRKERRGKPTALEHGAKSFEGYGVMIEPAKIFEDIGKPDRAVEQRSLNDVELDGIYAIAKLKMLITFMPHQYRCCDFQVRRIE